MNAAHLHLLLNHAPVIGTVFGILLLAVAVMRRSDELVRVGLGFFALLAVITVVVYLTGGAAEELVENLPGISEALIERHEESALAATIVLAVFGGAAAVGLVAFRRKPLPRPVGIVALVLSLISVGFMAWTANLGGQIRHTEIRAGVPTADAIRQGEER